MGAPLTNLWPEEKIEHLKVLWSSGISSMEISIAMKITKNAVLGKVHRLRLPARPSPIKRYTAPDAPPVSFLPPLPDPLPSPEKPIPEPFWTDDRTAELETLWRKGLSFAAIAREMHTTRSTISSKAHYLGLNRKSPIAVEQPPPPDDPSIVPEPAPVKAAHVVSKRTCCWPIGEPRKPGFRFCEAPTVDRLPYCEPHCAIAYPKRNAECAA
jgi:GcrA cell cycle regulator